jgi:hypothetical protein
MPVSSMRVGGHRARAGFVLAVFLVVALGSWQNRRVRTGRTHSQEVPPIAVPGEEPVVIPDPAPDRPDIVITSDHRLARARQKDAKGLSPYETVETVEGTVTIRRTFDSSGKLLEEKADLDGRQVPVPKLK